jgi:beta-glucosidase
MYLTRFLLLFIFAIVPVVTAQVYLDSTASVEARVSDLLSRMTMDEKIGQMTQAERGALNSESDISTYYLGSLLSGGGSHPGNNTAGEWAAMYNQYQIHALGTPLAIPLIYGVDAVHGHSNVLDAVIFPHNIGLGCTRNPELVREAARITALEVAGTGIDWTFAPCIAVPRDERWGRTYEGFGETAELAQMFAGAAVKGFQGDSLGATSSIVACAKHYLGDGGTTLGDDQGNTEVDEATLRSVHLPGYIDAIAAGSGTIMASYSSWNGVKMHGNYYLLTTVLKEELGFDGFVVSDWAGIDQLPGDYTSDIKESINAGIDMVMVPTNYIEFIDGLKALVQSGQVAESRIDDAVTRILRIKFRMGLFEHPYTNPGYTALVGSQPHRDVARQAVRESLVLLKKKDGILPLAKTGSKILVTGKSADDMGNQCGGWTISWQGASGDITTGTTVFEAIQQAAPGADVRLSDSMIAGFDPDVTVVVIGETPYAEGAGDRSDLNLDQDDILLVRQLKAAGQKVVLILLSGRPMILTPVLHAADVVIAAWLPGTEGAGISDVLFGDFQPSGLLGHSWPKSNDQIPINYGDADYDPLYPYGFGITSLDDSPAGSAPLPLSAEVRNDGMIEISFNKAMNDPSALSPQFAVYIDGGTTNYFQNAVLSSGDATTFIINPVQAITAGQSVTIDYSGTVVTSTDGGVLAGFSGFEVFPAFNPESAFAVPGLIQAENWSAMSGVQTEPTTDEGGGENVGWIDDGDWMEYTISVAEAGVYNLDLRVASLSAGGQVQFLLDGTAIGSTSIPVTGGWQTWTTISSEVSLENGLHTFRIFAELGGFNVNWFEFSPVLSLEEKRQQPEGFALLPNFPNPFNPTTTIEFRLDQAAGIKLAIYALNGSLIRSLINEHRPAGTHALTWDGKNDNGNAVASGIYLLRLSGGNHQVQRKIMLIR